MHTPQETFGLYQLIVFVVPPNNYYFLIFNFGGHWGVERVRSHNKLMPLKKDSNLETTVSNCIFSPEVKSQRRTVRCQGSHLLSYHQGLV